MHRRSSQRHLNNLRISQLYSIRVYMEGLILLGLAGAGYVINKNSNLLFCAEDEKKAQSKRKVLIYKQC